MYDSAKAAEEDYLKKLDDNVTRIGLIFNTTASYTLRFANDTVPMDIVSENPCEFIVFVTAFRRLENACLWDTRQKYVVDRGVCV